MTEGKDRKRKTDRTGWSCPIMGGMLNYYSVCMRVPTERRKSMTAWEALLGTHRKGKQLLAFLQSRGSLSDEDVAALDLLDLMQKQGLMHIKADRAVFQDLEEELTGVGRGRVWLLTAGGKNYTSHAAVYTLQRLALDLFLDNASVIREFYDTPCPFTGKLLFTSAPGGLAGPEEGIRLTGHMRRSDVFAAAEWLCRAYGMHAALTCIERQGQAQELNCEQLCMPGMEGAGEEAEVRNEEIQENWEEEEGVLSNAVQLGMPVFQDEAGNGEWVEVPIEASMTEAPDAMTARELADLLLEHEQIPFRGERNLPLQGVQLSFLDFEKEE